MPGLAVLALALAPFAAANKVCPAAADSGCAICPDAIARWAPAALATRAAAIFDTMPPDPMPDAEPVSAIASIAASIRSTRAI